MTGLQDARNQQYIVAETVKDFKQKNLKNEQLIEILRTGDEDEIMAAARLLRYRKAGNVIEPLADALQKNRHNASVGLEIVRALHEIGRIEAVRILFRHLFDDTNAIVAIDCNNKIAKFGQEALQQIALELSTVQFHRMIEGLGLAGQTVVEDTVEEIRNEIIKRSQSAEDKNRAIRTRDELKSMEAEMRHQHAIHQKKKGHQPPSHNPHQHKPKNRH